MRNFVIIFVVVVIIIKWPLLTSIQHCLTTGLMSLGSTHLRNFFWPLIRASYFRQSSHHSTKTRLLSLQSLSHRNQVRFLWGALYCSCHISKVLTVIMAPVFLLRLARIKARTILLVLLRFRPAILTGRCHM